MQVHGNFDIVANNGTVLNIRVPNVTTNFNKVREFNTTAGHPCPTEEQRNIVVDRPQRVNLRLKLIKEEVSELEESVQQNNFTEIKDALGDILYVVYGMGLEFGIDLDNVFSLIHESNMTKFCKTEEEAQKTVEWYKENEKRYKSPTYRKAEGCEYWVVYNADDDKILKSINYHPVDLN